MTNELLIPKKASEWIVLLNDDPDNLSLQRDFQLWLESDVNHREDWDEISRTWHLLGIVGPSLDNRQVVSVKAPQLSLPAGKEFGEVRRDSTAAFGHLITKSGFARGLMRSAALLILFLVIGLSLPHFKYLGADFASNSSEISIVDLADGSQVILAPDTAINVEISDQERRVTILSGSGYFEVKKDKNHPFIVGKENIQTKVLGTAFVVEQQGEDIRVAVTEGLVQVNDLKDEAVSVQLRPGEQISFQEMRGYSLSKSPVGDIALWRSGYLKVHDQSLDAVVSQIDRYFNGHIFIQDADIGEKRLTGVFKLEQPRKSLRGIASLHGLEVTEISPWVIILSKK